MECKTFNWPILYQIKLLFYLLRHLCENPYHANFMKQFLKEIHAVGADT